MVDVVDKEGGQIQIVDVVGHDGNDVRCTV